MNTYQYKPCPIVKKILNKDYTCAGNIEGDGCPFFTTCPEQLIEDIFTKHAVQMSHKLALRFASIIKKGMNGQRARRVIK